MHIRKTEKTFWIKPGISASEKLSLIAKYLESFKSSVLRPFPEKISPIWLHMIKTTLCPQLISTWIRINIIIFLSWYKLCPTLIPDNSAGWSFQHEGMKHLQIWPRYYSPDNLKETFHSMEKLPYINTLLKNKVTLPYSGIRFLHLFNTIKSTHV